MSRAIEFTEFPEPIGNFIIENADGVQAEDGKYYHYSVVCNLLKKYADKYKGLHDLAKGRLNKAHEYTDKLESRIIKLEVAMSSIIGLVNYPDEVSKTAKDVMGITNTTPEKLEEK